MGDVASAPSLSRKPTLTVLLCNYNHAPLLERCLDAYLSQSHAPDHFIVWDDASTDNSVEIIERRLRGVAGATLKVNDVNRGPLANCQAVLDGTTDDYIYLGASDDLVLPGFFEKALGTLSRFPQSGFFCSNHEFFDVRSESITKYPLPLGQQPRYFSPDQIYQKLLTQRAFAFPSHTVILRVDELRRAGGFPEEHGFRVDWFYQIVIAARRGFCFHPDTLARYSVGAPNTLSGTGVANEQRDLAIMRKLLHRLSLPEYADARRLAFHPAVVSFNDTFQERFVRLVQTEVQYEQFRHYPAFSTYMPRLTSPA